ncbi:hypothetical protein EKH55_5884 (plasmid) [Sinorhizobium alkalisoli]|nr:hypothetical protein EKH55_5884 [Sinorhizobium alkalisoli]
MSREVEFNIFVYGLRLVGNRHSMGAMRSADFNYGLARGP